LKFVCDIVRCAIENLIALVETGADENMSNKRCSVIVETVSNVSECLQVTVARLGDLVDIFIESERDLSRVTPRSLMESDRGTIEPTTLMWEILDKILFR